MKFKKIDDNNVRCTIAEDEIEEMGYTLEEIMKNGERTKEFMDHIFAMAQKQCQVDFSMALRTVQAELRSDHTLCLTFSQYETEEVFKSDKLFHSLMAALEKAKQESYTGEKDAEEENVPQEHDALDLPEEESKGLPETIVLLVFDDMDHVLRFAKQMRKSITPKNSLLKHKKKYYLRMDMTGFSYEQVQKLSMITDEYVEEVVAGSAKSAYIEEHGEVLVKNEAIEHLKQL